MRRLVLALVVPIVMVTAACGTEDGSATDDASGSAPEAGTLADVKVTGSTDAKPEVDFQAPMSFPETTSRVIEEGPGTGKAISPTSTVTVDYVGVNARDGAEFDSSWKTGQPATFALEQVIPGFSQGLAGAHEGDRVLVGIASKDGYDPTGNGSTILKGDSLIFVVDVREVTTPPKPLPEAKGTPKQAPSDVPQIVLDQEGHPQEFKPNAQTAKDPQGLGVYPVIEGTGPKVESGQNITVHYVGQNYPDGEVFDSSWERGEPITTPIGTGQVIPGWDQGLVGQRVGSRVVLVIPSDLGYGEQGSPPSIPANSDLIFAVDILAAS